MKKTVVFSILVAGLLHAAQTVTGGVERDLCIALDGSGSMGSDNFSIQKNATADQIEDPTVVPQDGTVAISVVQFASDSTVEVSRTVIDSSATAANVAAQIRNIVYSGGGTNMVSAIETCTSQIDLADTAAKKIIDLSTDGQPNSLADTIAAADGAVADGVDVINALGTGDGVDENQLNQIVRPQPASTIPDDGFVVIAPDFNSYTAAIKEKMAHEAGGSAAPAPQADSVSVPLSVEAKALFSLLLAAASLMFVRRRVTA